MAWTTKDLQANRLREDRVMSNLNSEQFESAACSTCGNPRGAEVEIGGRGARGCPSCGGSLSPVVGIKKIEPQDHGAGFVAIGRVTNNGRPVLGTDRREETGSVVYRRADGSHGAQVVDWDQTPYVGSGKSPRAAALEAHHKLAEAHGKVFRPRTGAERKRINDAAKDLGYGSEWERY